jgi:hypothetical protein
MICHAKCRCNCRCQVQNRWEFALGRPRWGMATVSGMPPAATEMAVRPPRQRAVRCAFGVQLRRLYRGGWIDLLAREELGDDG